MAIPAYSVVGSGFTQQSASANFAQNGWTDMNGNVWSVSSAGLLASATVGQWPATYGALLRPASEATQDGRIRCTFVFSPGGANIQPYLYVRHNRSTTGATCYAANMDGTYLHISAFVGNTYYLLVSSAPGAFSSGTTYVLDFSAVGVNPTNLYLSVYLADGQTLAGPTITLSDSGLIASQTSALQSGVGSCGVGIYNGSATPIISYLATYTDIAPTATSYLLSGPSAGNVGVAAGPFVVVPNNGTLANASVITLSDNTGLGTFAVAGTVTTTGTLAAGTTAGFNFTYDASLSGPKTISSTNSTGLTNPPSLPFNANGTVYWYPLLGTTTWSATASSVSAGGSLPDGWEDPNGSSWAVSLNSGTGQYGLYPLKSNNTVTSGPLLQTTGANPADGNARLTGTFYYNEQVFFVARHNGNTVGASCYAIAFAGTNLVPYKWVNGTFTAIGTQSANFTSPPSSLLLSFDFQCVQTSAGTTTLSLVCYYPANSGTVAGGGACQVTVTDTSSTLQTANLGSNTGSIGFATYSSGTPPTSPTIISAQVWSDVQPPATGVQFSVAPQGGQTGVAQTFTLATVNNGSLSSAVVLTPNDGGAGGTFSPTAVTLNSSVLSASFTYTATTITANPITISAPITSGGSGLTAPTPQTFTASLGPTTYAASSSYLYFSPGNWTCGATRTGQSWRQSWNNGAWFQFSWTASTGQTCTLNISSPSTSTNAPTLSNPVPNYISYFLNNTLYDNIPVPASGTYAIPTNQIAASATNVLRVYLRNSNQGNRWQTGGTGYTPLAFVKLSSIAIDGGSTPIAPTTGRPWGMIVGDSITEGIQSNGGADNHLTSYSYLVAQCMDDAGFDTCISACGYNGWMHTGDYTADVPGYYLPTGVSGTSRWNLIDSGVSILDANNQISSYGATGTAPAFILLNLGTNEALYNTSTTLLASNVNAAVYQCLVALRAAAPLAVIAVMIPFPLYTSTLFSSYTSANGYLTAIKAAVANYLLAYPGDGKTFLLDLGATACQTVYATSAWNNSGVHPLFAGSAYLAPRVARALCQALKIVPPTFRSYPFARL